MRKPSKVLDLQALLRSMKKGRSNTLTVCFLFLLFVVVHHLFLSPFSRIKNIKGHTTSKLNQPTNQDPLLSSSSKPHPTRKISCDRTDKFYDICTVDGPTTMDPTTSTFYLVDPKTRAHPPPPPPPYITEKIRPYPRKWESIAIRKIKQITITSEPRSPPCKISHNLPALVFSLGGSLGNVFYEFIEGLIPLFITVNYVYPEGNHEFILVISNSKEWWVDKYRDVLQAFSKHPIISLDNETSTHCFTSATLGLVSHGYMSIDPTLLPKPITFSDFHDFLAKAYGRNPNSKLTSPLVRPRLLLITRKGSVGRVLLNEADVKRVAREVGFDIVMFGQSRRTQMREAYDLISSSHAMLGVHGSALTYSLFLRPGSVFVQVVPLGIEELAEVYYGNSAKEMGLEYVEYKIGVDESTLAEKYDRNSLMITDPVAYIGKNWSYALMDTYRKEQDVMLDLVRFREYLVRVYDKAKKFMDKEG